MNKIKSHFFILVDVYTINKSIIINHHIKIPLLEGWQRSLSLSKWTGWFWGDRHAIPPPYTRFVIHFFQMPLSEAGFTGF
jgi:hypothetical protein